MKRHGLKEEETTRGGEKELKFRNDSATPARMLPSHEERMGFSLQDKCTGYMKVVSRDHQQVNEPGMRCRMSHHVRSTPGS